MSLYDELTRAARRRLLMGISGTDRLIRQIFVRAADALAEQARAAKSGSLTQRWATAYLGAMREEIERMDAQIEAVITDAALDAARARVEVTQAWLERVAAMARVDDSFIGTLGRVPTDTLRALIDGKLYTGGKLLSDRIWQSTARLEGNLEEIIYQGVAQQMDAITMARMLEAYVKPDAACPVSWHKLYPDIPFDRKVDYNALRLARTSLTHAHWAAGKAAAKRNPLCSGMKWHLSDSHYERQVEVWGEDVCDEYAAHDEGLGVGVWPIDKLPMPHPNCLCYQTEALPSLEDAAEMLRDSLDGKVSNPAIEADYQQWLKDNAAELENLRRGNNGAEAVDNGGGNDTIEEEDIVIPRSLGAKYINHEVELPDGSKVPLTEGTRITNIKVIAGKGRERGIDILPLLMKSGGSEYEWQKKKGIGYVDYMGESCKAEIHWYEEPSVGIEGMKVKTKNGRWIIDDD